VSGYWARGERHLSAVTCAALGLPGRTRSRWPTTSRVEIWTPDEATLARKSRLCLATRTMGGQRRWPSATRVVTRTRSCGSACRGKRRVAALPRRAAYGALSFGNTGVPAAHCSIRTMRSRTGSATTGARSERYRMRSYSMDVLAWRTSPPDDNSGTTTAHCRQIALLVGNPNAPGWRLHLELRPRPRRGTALG